MHRDSSVVQIVVSWRSGGLGLGLVKTHHVVARDESSFSMSSSTSRPDSGYTKETEDDTNEGKVSRL